MCSQEPVPGASAAPPLSRPRHQVVELIVALIKSKGQKAADEVRRRAESGEGICVKGYHVDAGVLKDALKAASTNAVTSPTAATGDSAGALAGRASVNTSQPAASSSAAPGSAGATVEAGRRFTPQVSAAALASKAIMECETAEPFNETIVVVGGSKVAVLPKPSTLAKPTGEYLNAGESAQVIARTLSPRDGRVYVRLQKYSGWVSTRSRKEFAKVVLAAPSSAVPLEPPACGALLPSRVTKFLPALSPAQAGMEVASDAATSTAAATSTTTAPAGDVRRFRAVGGRVPIQSTPSQGGVASAVTMMQVKEVFEADGIFTNPGDGRAYLRLTGGRGWVCERSRLDFSRFVVEPLVAGSFSGDDHIGEYVGEDKPSTVRQRAPMGKKVIALEHTVPEVSPEVAAQARRTSERSAMPSLVVYRSDKELWPDDLQPPRPIDSEMRLQLRRIFNSYSKRVQESHRDLQEVERRADSYAKACPAQKELQKFAEQLRKENSKVQAEWTKAIEAVLPNIRETAASAKSLSECNASSGLFPVQVCGERWYCASLCAGRAEDDAGPNRHLGPLRQTSEAAADDLQRMRAHLEEPEPKRQRITAKNKEKASESSTETSPVSAAGG